MQRFYILNDLFTSPEFRGSGIGKALLDAAKELVKDHGMKGLALETELANPAQTLYQREGWKKDEEYLHYFWKNT
jgi:GNAT superfamily N-acetyltransferase